jgi:small subunit ribosomal protein S16
VIGGSAALRGVRSIGGVQERVAWPASAIFPCGVSLSRSLEDRMVRIRMQRLGRTHRPFYRICAIDQRTRRNGQVIERLGWYNPLEQDETKQLELNAERVQYWLSMGAQPSETMEDMLGRLDLLPEKRKADWERRRSVARARVSSKVSVKTAEEAVAAIGKLAGSTEADVSAYASQANEALKSVRAAVAGADVDAAARAADQASSALTAATKADEDAKAAKAAAEAKAKAEEEAAKAAETPAEESAAE